MVIETKEQYSALLKSVQNKDVDIVVIGDDHRNHPVESGVVMASLRVDSEIYDVVFNHSESFSELSIADMTGVKRFWVDAAKSFYHLTGFENVYDVRLMNWANESFFADPSPSNVFDFVYSHSPRRGNEIVPLVKVLEYSRDRLMYIDKMKQDLSVTKHALRYNKAAITLAKVEQAGMKLRGSSFDSVFKNGYGYSNYNMFTSTGRPSNTFSGINFGALNKTDGTRKNILSRFDNGMLVEFDYDAYHLRLLGDILDFKFPIDKSLHQYFADEVYHTSYDEAKEKTFQILYGNYPIDEEKNPFFYGVDRLAHAIQDYFSQNKCFKSHIYNKPFSMENVIDVNKNKLLNYYIQSYETERNLGVIKEVQDYLQEKNTKMILYTYDSFLFDFDINEGLNTIKDLKNIVESKKFPVRIGAGTDYDSLTNITEKLHESK